MALNRQGQRSLGSGRKSTQVHKGAKWGRGKGNMEYELSTEQHSLFAV